MFYGQTIHVPANTIARSVLGKSSVVKVDRIRVCPGTTRQTWIGFPDGCYGLVHAVVCRGNVQVWPAEPGYSFNWNDYTYTFEDPLKLTAEPYEFTVKTWSYDDRFPHNLFFGVIVEPAPVIEVAVSMEQVLEELGITIGETV